MLIINLLLIKYSTIFLLLTNIAFLKIFSVKYFLSDFIISIKSNDNFSIDSVWLKCKSVKYPKKDESNLDSDYESDSDYQYSRDFCILVY